MNKDFIPYEQALELKEIEFNETCLGWFKNNELTTSFNDLYTNPKERGKRFEIINAPTFSQAFRWFREKYNIDGFVRIEPLNEKYGFVIYNRGKNNFKEFSTDYTKTEEAELTCLKKLIELVKKELIITIDNSNN